MDYINAWLDNPAIRTLVGCVLLIFAASMTWWLARRVLRRLLRVISRRTRLTLDDALLHHGIAGHLAGIAAMLVLAFGIQLVSGIPSGIDLAIRNVTLALLAVFCALAISATMSAIEDDYTRKPENSHRSIKGYVQLLRILLFAATAIIVIATLINRSPLTLLAGLGAVSAVLLLVFKDTLMSVVASVQLRSNDMLRVGDWIEMPSQNADGDVIDIALHTIKVQNWDKTISTVPTWRLISDSYRNWRGMTEIGGRRIKRALYLDATSARFLSDDEIGKLRRFHLLEAYFARKHGELDSWNSAQGAAGKQQVNRRRLTNLGSFRAYAQAYLDSHPRINHDLFCLVRQRDPGATGIPMELYCFTASTAWADYENAQGDIFDHLIAILPEFGLRLFQQPTGADMRSMLLAEDRAATPAIRARC
ncbi:MAG TPA: mechanosensitive ion channel domain-containing protein [Rhodanobacteraceae bacterium]|nr:mechanosensitive ion channel domain-containing protein [Rhodanobacteraceae bacterium]